MYALFFVMPLSLLVYFWSTEAPSQVALADLHEVEEAKKLLQVPGQESRSPEYV